MKKQEAYKIVLEDLKQHSLLTGNYDARTENAGWFMNGI